MAFSACNYWIFLTVTALWLSGCRHPVTDTEGYNAWLNEPENGCIQTRRVAGATLTVKYQPDHYIRMKDSVEGSRPAYRDSLGSTLVFLLSVLPQPNDPRQSLQAASQAEGRDYIEERMTANFFMSEHISAHAMGGLYKPVLAIVENVYELSPAQNFLIIFSDTAFLRMEPQESFVFLYEDPLGVYGKLQFPFRAADLIRAENIAL